MIQSASPHAEDARGTFESVRVTLAQIPDDAAATEECHAVAASAQALAQAATAEAILAVADELAALRQALRPNGASDE